MSTQAQNQSSLSLVRKELVKLEDMRIALKKTAQEFWKQCIPNTPEGENAFNNLNLIKKRQRYVKARIRKLSNLSRKLKSV